MLGACSLSESVASHAGQANHEVENAVLKRGGTVNSKTLVHRLCRVTMTREELRHNKLMRMSHRVASSTNSSKMAKRLSCA
jgi:hypothetical protein